jgi:hypothetical protein
VRILTREEAALAGIVDVERLVQVAYMDGLAEIKAGVEPFEHRLRGKVHLKMANSG